MIQNAYKALSKSFSENDGIYIYRKETDQEDEQYILKVEESREIVPFARYTIQRAFDYQAQLNNNGITTQISINLSAANLHEHGLADFIIRISKEKNIAPKQICFEITESTFITHQRTAINIIEAITYYQQ